jgi:hypothetical protein
MPRRRNAQTGIGAAAGPASVSKCRCFRSKIIETPLKIPWRLVPYPAYFGDYGAGFLDGRSKLGCLPGDCGHLVEQEINF